MSAVLPVLPRALISAPLPRRLCTSAVSPSCAAASNWPERLDPLPGTAAGRSVGGVEAAPPGCRTGIAPTVVPGCGGPAAPSPGVAAPGEAGTAAVGFFEALAGVDADGFS